MFSFENLRGKLARGLAKIEPFANAWFDDWQQTMHTVQVAGSEANKSFTRETGQSQWVWERVKQDRI